MILLWSILIFLTLIASFFSLRTLWHFPAPSSSESAQQHANNAWYLERLDDLEFSFAQQEIDAAAFEQNKLQLQKDFLTFETQTQEVKRLVLKAEKANVLSEKKISDKELKDWIN